jgi:hypothetical protein
LSGSRGRGEERAALDADETGRKQVVVAHDRSLQSVDTLTVWRARSSFVAVGSHAAEKRLSLNVRRKRFVGSHFGKKPCDINKRLGLF